MQQAENFPKKFELKTLLIMIAIVSVALGALSIDFHEFVHTLTILVYGAC